MAPKCDKIDDNIVDWNMTLSVFIGTFKDADDTLYSSQTTQKRIRGLAKDGFPKEIVQARIEDCRVRRLRRPPSHVPHSAHTILVGILEPANDLRHERDVVVSQREARALKTGNVSGSSKNPPAPSKPAPRIKQEDQIAAWPGRTYESFLNSLIKSESSDCVIEGSARREHCLKILSALSKKRTEKDVRKGIIHFIAGGVPKRIRCKTIELYHHSQLESNPNAPDKMRLSKEPIPLGQSSSGNPTRSQNPQTHGPGPASSSGSEPFHEFTKAFDNLGMTAGTSTSPSQNQPPLPKQIHHPEQQYDPYSAITFGPESGVFASRPIRLLGSVGTYHRRRTI